VSALPADFDANDPALYEQRIPLDEFALLRKTAPVWWNAQPRGRDGFQDDGHWVVTRHKDIKEISRNDKVFSSFENTAIVRFAEGIERDQIDMQRVILLNMDAPQHTRMRNIISRGFTPRAIAALKDSLRERAQRIVEEAAQKDGGDFVIDLASELPLQAIAEMLGVPQEDRKKMFDWSNTMVNYDDPEFEGEGIEAVVELLQYFMPMAEERRACPANDLVTKLVNADVDGHSLTPDEFGFFVILLAVAGNETTRNAISQGMLAFMENPEQWEIYKAERPETAADEIVRWATPVTCFQRTATEDVELDGVLIKKGDRVGMYYSSANFDEDVFDEPNKFNILRDPNPHLGFGGTGAHYCIGANLARAEIDLIFNAIADVMPNISLAGKPRRVRHAWINGLKECPVKYH
jgi:cholest-4-en-3-one 26-monooxygenase